MLTGRKRVRKKIRYLWADDFFRHSSITFISSQLAGVLNLLFYMVIIRLLTVEDYGVFNSLVAVTLYFGQISSALQPVMARFLAVEIVRGRVRAAAGIFKRVGRDLGLVSLAILAGFVLFAGRFAAWQKIDDASLLRLVGLIVAGHLIAFLFSAFLQGAQLFNQFALVNVLYALVKFAAGVGLVALGMGAGGALGGFLLAPVLLIIVGAGCIRAYYRQQPVCEDETAPGVGEIYLYIIPTSLALLSFAVLTNIDVTLVKALFTPRQAGFYSSAQLVGKIILYLSYPLSIVVFPKAASLNELKTSSIHLLNRGFKLGLILCGSATAICWAAPELVSRVLIGSADAEVVSLVGLFALAMTFYSLLWLVVSYNLSIRSTRFIKYLALAAVAQAAAIHLYHPSLTAVLFILNSFAAISLIGTLFCTPGFRFHVTHKCNAI